MSCSVDLETPRADLAAWLAAVGFPARDIQPLAGDVSPRRYARITGENGGTAILASYPPEVRATCPRFLRTGELLAAAGVPVPQVLAADCAEGWMLLADLGPATLGDWKERPWGELGHYFTRALHLLGQIARLPAAELAGLNPPLGAELLRRELQQTWDLFLEPRGLVGDTALAARLQAALDEICVRLGAEPAVPCHRDFMSRNLMPLDGTGELAVLDHQDLRLGPPAYDLASLLNDTLFPPADLEEELLAAALPSLPVDDPRTSYHRAAAQRTLKAVGTYTAFARRGAERHLPLIPPTLARGLAHLGKLPEGAPLAAELAALWAPALEPPRR